MCVYHADGSCGRYSKHPKLCAFGYLGGMGCVMLLLIVNSIVAFGSADGVQNADPVAMLTHGKWSL